MSGVCWRAEGGRVKGIRRVKKVRRSVFRLETAIDGLKGLEKISRSTRKSLDRVMEC